MPGPRQDRDLSEMVHSLETQLNVLEEHAQKAFGERREEFLPEVATKLRVLLVRSRHNKPLLFEVADHLGIEMTVTLDGPPVLRSSPENPHSVPGDKLSLDAFFDLMAVMVRTSAGLVPMTKRELVRAWSEQLGGSHEDWSVDEALVNAVRTEVPILGFRPMLLELCNCVNTTLHHGRRVAAVAKERLGKP